MVAKDCSGITCSQQKRHILRKEDSLHFPNRERQNRQDKLKSRLMKDEFFFFFCSFRFLKSPKFSILSEFERFDGVAVYRHVASNPRKTEQYLAMSKNAIAEDTKECSTCFSEELKGVELDLSLNFEI